MDSVDVVRKFYDETVNYEWQRLERHQVEFELSKRYITRYVGPNDKVLDLGGGPGKYSLHLSQLGSEMTLADLSQNNVNFALNKAQELGLPLNGLQADCRDLSAFKDEQFDHVLCMGPMYHLMEENDRITTINECLRVLKPNGTLIVSFVSSYSFVWDYLIRNPSKILEEESRSQLNAIVEDKNFIGLGFSENFFIRPKDVLSFFKPFRLERLHLLNCESFLYLRETELLSQPPEVVRAWLDLAEQVCEREDILSLAEHFMFIGRKQKED
ncbi:class I SAM-dependent methyltransferase [Paenibacillus sacheonensis]|uniref:Methyltransferase domain-containing protein n=1 Tax=Paenibacillus sacheonensis TaxID=742054 RepID=A0A7X4YUY7_9BACL|nr:class I SAM-dependent methyltransferase [Paenibacillus sacheonensis]MBM7569190.1 ubiquinone/menaquinone biosynthesis C-methylase UbiE [Paenibacillus sacheonensis]NBC73015.1 methyltransferase domain-containing protein [Paenibacillus sacheonensis]